MRLDDVWVAGTGGALGDLVPIADAVAAGRYDAFAAESSAMLSYSRAAQAPPEMAVAAGREALKEAAELDVHPAPGTVLVHSHTSFQGLDMWPAECWIAGELLGARLTGMPMTVGAASNGSLAALEVAACVLTAQRDVPAALITIGDRFPEPVDRWNLSPGMVFGDGAAAAVLTRRRGRLRLLSVAAQTDTALEGLSRGNEPFHLIPQQRPDTARRTREFLARGELSLRDVRTRAAEGVRLAVHRALSDADLSLDDVDWFVPPFVGAALFRESFVKPLGFEPRRTLAAFGRTVGHLGPADQLYALSHLVKNELLAPGERVLLVGTGMGFTFSAAVLEAVSV